MDFGETEFLELDYRIQPDEAGEAHEGTKEDEPIYDAGFALFLFIVAGLAGWGGWEIIKSFNLL